MTEVAFVGEVRREPAAARDDTYRLVRDYTAMLAGLGALAAAIYGIFLGFIVTPFYYYDAIAVIGVAIGPAVLVLIGMKLLAPGVGGPIKRLDALCGLFLFCIAAPGNYVLLLNQKLDHSPAVKQTLRVEDTWIRSGRHGNDAYMASVQPTVQSPIGRRSLYSSQPVRLGQAEWRNLVPGESMLTLRVHPGRFGFSWYEPDPKAVAR
jgi:hypothetical protein